MATTNDNRPGLGCLIVILIVGVIICIYENNGEKRNSEVGNEDSPSVESAEIETIDPIIEEYKDNQLNTGVQPYENESSAKGSNSEIVVKTSGTDRTDVIVILKKNDLIVRNKYVQAGDQVVFSVPNGTYQIFFYYGKGWYPEKDMPNGMKGGFVQYESFSKDDPQYLEDNILTYELILQTNGNFSARPSNAEEAF